MRIAVLLAFLLAATDVRAQCVFAPEYLSFLAALPPNAPSSIVIAGQDEPGERLVVLTEGEKEPWTAFQGLGAVTVSNWS